SLTPFSHYTPPTDIYPLSLHDALPISIQSMTHEELAQVAQDIRRFLIEQLSVTGGHIGPNLGVVELTLMLHKLFDSPNDKFIWRSEEHTSELQSRFDLVCRLLLEKKKI